VKDVVDEMDGLMDEHQAFLNRRTGELITMSTEDLSEAEDEVDISEYPDWQQDIIEKAKEVIDDDDFLPLPSKFEINEYRIMKDFCWSVQDPGMKEDLLDKIRGQGAFRRFKDATHFFGIEEAWHQFRQEALENIAIGWLEEHEIPYTRGTN
jgi:hypothetical protein